MKGKRVFDAGVFAPGEYGKHGDVWLACTPNGHLANLSRHTVIENEDSSITVSPSILVTTTNQGKPIKVWHGYLENGVWRGTEILGTVVDNLREITTFEYAVD